MTNSKDPLGQDALLAEASRWFAALDAGTARVDEFEAWRASNPAHAVAYARIVGQWEAMRTGAGPLVEVPNAPMQASRRQWLKFAAVALPVAALGSGFLAERAYAWDSAATKVGETRRVALPDGSVAYLNTDSALSWRFGSGDRILRLDRGEVALDIRSGGEDGAVLHAGEASLPLAPGLFDARIAGGRAELTLVDGAALRLPDGGRELTLRRNETIVMAADTAPRLEARSSEQVASQMAWRMGEIVFLDESVAAAAAEFNRHLTRKITVASADLAREKIGGRFDLDRPDQFLQAVSLSLDARIVPTANGFELVR